MHDQDEADIETSNKVWNVIATYMKWKYEADKNLSKRTAFKWTMLRPGGLTDAAGAGTATIGRTHISKSLVSVSLISKLQTKDNSHSQPHGVERGCGKNTGAAS